MKWPMVKLGEVAPAKPIKTPNILDPQNVWQLNLDMVESHSGRVVDKVYGALEDAGSSTHWFGEEHVLYSKLRPYLNKVVIPDEVGLATTELVPMLPDPERLDRKYLAYYLRSKKFVAWVNEQVAGAKMPRVSMKVFWEHEIPLPPLEEQKRIAAILDKADAICQKRKQAIQLADDFLRAVFLDMFGDPVTNPKGWETQELGDVLRVRRGASPRPIKDFLGGTVPWIKIGDGSKGDQIYLHDTKEYVTQAGADKSVFLEAGSLIFANCGVSLGFARILTKAGCIHDGWLAFDEIDESLNKIFILKWLNQLTLHFRRIAPDGTQPNLNTAIMKKQSIICPPIELQRQFEKIVHSTDAFLNRYKHGDTLTILNFNSLCHKAFSGQL